MNDEQEKRSRKVDYIHNKIKCMSREEKAAEFKQYLVSGNLLRVDVDQIMADQAFVGAPDSAMDEALLKIASLVGAMLGTAPLTAQELIEALEDPTVIERRQAHIRGLRIFEPQLSLRRRRME